MKQYVRLLSVFLVCLALVSCKGKTLVKEDISAQAAAGEEAAETEVVAEDVTEEGGVGEEAAYVAPTETMIARATAIEGLRPVHFDFDRYNIREGDREILRENADWLKRNTGVAVLIEGHADERGENEYNLALGERRASSVKRFLQSLGVDPERLTIISYGEERPADPGHDENAWGMNRRAEFKKLD